MPKVQTSLRFGMVVTAAGGFLDSYSFMSHGGVFAGAQTGNFVQLGIHVARWDGSEMLRLLVPILGFIVGVAFAALLTQTRLQRVVHDPFRMALAVELGLLATVGFMPSSVSTILISGILCFAAGIQLVIFHQLHSWAFSTTITQGNVVNTITATMNVLFNNDKAERERARVFASVTAAFVIGAAVGGVMTVVFGSQGVLGAILLLLIALGMLIRERSNA